MFDGSRPRTVAGMVLAAVIFSLCTHMARAQEGKGFSFVTVRNLARALAEKDFSPEKNSDLPDEFKKMSYEAYSQIRFREDHNLWKDDHLRFTGEFFHRGYLFNDPVKVHVVDHGQVSDVTFAQNLFDYGTNRVSKELPATTQFGGFRLLFPLNTPKKMDEVAEFLGASYFRFLGASQRYGASLRGLAIDTAEPSGEEFPHFTEFWLEKPQQLTDRIKIYALMDSPSVAGAYSFMIEPGASTVVKVETSLFFRKSPKKIGIATLGSLFLMGQNRTRYIPDYRPQVHDSDGLLIEASQSDWIWRALVNPAKEHRISRFPVAEVKGFGLMQRDREFSDYDDLASRYDLRPSYWVEPEGKWGPGTIELVEIPTPSDWNDNIVAYWVPKDIPAPKQELHLTYRISTLGSAPEQVPLLRVASTRIRPEEGGTPPRFVINFSGNSAIQGDMDSARDIDVRSSEGKVRNLVVQTNDATGGWQVFFDLADAGDRRTEVHVRLQPGHRPVSEMWVYDYQKSN